MTKKLLIFATGLMAMFTQINDAHAQVREDIFNIPDTVCTDHEIEPYDIIENASTYNWSFCPPNLGDFPTGENLGPFGPLNTPAGFRIVQDGNNTIGFFLNKDGYINKMRYENGIKEAPSFIREVGKVSNTGTGLYTVNSGNEWHVFVIGGSAWNFTNLMRIDYANGLIQEATNVTNFGNLDSTLTTGNQIVVAKDNDNKWYGFTVNNHNELLRLDFGTDIKTRPTVVNLGVLFNNLRDVTDFELVKELDNWHLFITNKRDSEIKRISFGNSFLNPAFVINYGNLGDLVARPVGLSITRDCDRYYGWVLSEGNNNLVGLVWNNSIADTPTARNLGNFMGIRQAQVLTNTVRQDGGLYMLSTNNFDQSISLIEYNPCTFSDIAYKDQRLPPTFKYSEPGVYTVTLTTDEGLPTVKTECQDIVVYAHPDIIPSNTEKVLCQNDSFQIQVLIFGIDSMVWSPRYNIDTTKGNTVNVWPQQNTDYTYTTYFNRNCVVKQNVEVTVSKIFADAGPDRTFSDGSSTSLGGPNTTTGPGYDFHWTPNIGLTGSEWTSVTTAKPPYSITYYLEVTNDDGCRAIDSVNINIPCDQISIPNAFTPNSTNPATNTFKILNTQFSKLNSFSIYDRWGKKIFETIDVAEGWDGTVDGKPAPLGVYVWEVDANCANTFERFRTSGNVTLIR